MSPINQKLSLAISTVENVINEFEAMEHFIQSSERRITRTTDIMDADNSALIEYGIHLGFGTDTSVKGFEISCEVKRKSDNFTFGKAKSDFQFAIALTRMLLSRLRRMEKSSCTPDIEVNLPSEEQKSRNFRNHNVDISYGNTSFHLFISRYNQKGGGND